MASRLAGVAAAASALVACVTASAPVSLEYAQGAAIAFESIDGPPRPIFDRLVRDLGEEASARGLVVVPRGREANYRIRGYLAVQAESASIAWAWDVYDAGRQHAFRLTGVERTAGRSSWAAVDDALLRRIARTGVERLTLFIATDRAPARGIARSLAPPGISLVSTGDDFRPEAAGIFRILDGAAAPATGTPAPPDR
jgi:hypothetical protein